MFAELLRPFSYLSIKHPDSKVLMVNWVIPIVLTIACVGALGYWKVEIDTYSSSGLLTKLLGFVQSLPGFYLAALAAVATFNNPAMDKLMPGTPPTGWVLHNGKLTEVQLTRRRMLCTMFAYLTAVSFALTIAAITATTLAAPIKAALPDALLTPARLTFLTAYLTFLFQMLSITLWSLFYLGERIHTPD